MSNDWTAGGVESSPAYPRGNVMALDCPSRPILNRLTSRWGVLVLIALQSGTMRFSDLRRRIGGVRDDARAGDDHGLDRLLRARDNREADRAEHRLGDRQGADVRRRGRDAVPCSLFRRSAGRR